MKPRIFSRDVKKEGLVHKVDNARSGIKHICNCCGHYCWNLDIIRRLCRNLPCVGREGGRWLGGCG